MATIESLDLATLTNNPQSIAEALEDVLETSSGNIASLKSTAQTDQQYISNTLKPQAQADADTLSDLVDDAPSADVLSLDLTVTDRSNKFDQQTGWLTNNHALRAYSFLGFMFVSINNYTTSTPSSGDKVFQINDSDFYPNQRYSANTISYQRDSAFTLDITTSGEIIVYYPENPGSEAYHIVSSFWYRYAN